MIDDHYIYVFVRQDLPIQEQMLDGIHVVERLANRARYSQEGIPNVVLVGLPSEKSLAKAWQYARQQGFDYQPWTDPDKDLTLRALAVGPLSPQQKTAMLKYRLYSPGGNVSSPLAPTSGLNANGGANAAVAQEREHPVSNREVEGSSPSCGSNLIDGATSA